MWKSLPAVFILLQLCGCASSLQKRLYADYAPEALDKSAMGVYTGLIKSLQDSSNGGFAIPKDCFQPVVPTAQAEQCAAYRNEAVAALVVGSDALCVEHRKTIYGNDASWNIASGTLTSFFAGAASVAQAERAKSILAALALFSNSERSLVNETVYKQILITAVDKKIVEGRETRADAIYQSLKLPMSSYPMHSALRDVFSLHNSCSFMNGLQKALEEGNQGSNAQKIVRLRTNLATIGAEMDAISVADRAGKSKDKYDQLLVRYKAVGETLKALEAN